MTVVMFKVIALGFQGVIVLVFDFPARTPGFDDGFNIARAEAMIGGKAIAVPVSKKMLEY